MERRIQRRRGAHNQIDSTDTNIAPYQTLQQRSQSFKELSTVARQDKSDDWPSLDIRDSDSVTRWTSQILAQLDALPPADEATQQMSKSQVRRHNIPI
jgi:hypothetical protein